MNYELKDLIGQLLLISIILSLVYLLRYDDDDNDDDPMALA